MTPASTRLPPLRVEKALSLLPEIQAVDPLRALLLSISRPDEGALWSSSGPYLTLGKRGFQPEELERRMPEACSQATERLRELYAACVDALQAQQRGDGEAAAAALLRAGRFEEAGGRLSYARACYEVALRVAEGLQDRRPEVEALRSLGQVALQVGAYAVGARYFQRAFALAEAELDTLGAIAASEGLGDAALRQEQLSGAHSWYSRGLRLAEASGDQVRWGRFERQLGVLAQRQGDLASASDHLSRSRVRLEPSGDAHEMARTLAAQGALEVELGNYQAASAAYREALAWVQREPKDAELEMDIRTRIGELLLEAGRLLEAEEELRRAEEVAIAANLTVRLIHLYTLMGQLRGRQADETGFVFFEQAIDLCRMVGPSPTAEAHVYFEYGRFRQRLEQLDEARAYFERARGMFERAGESAQQDRAAKALGQLSA